MNEHPNEARAFGRRRLDAAFPFRPRAVQTARARRHRGSHAPSRAGLLASAEVIGRPCASACGKARAAFVPMDLRRPMFSRGGAGNGTRARVRSPMHAVLFLSAAVIFLPQNCIFLP